MKVLSKNVLGLNFLAIMVNHSLIGAICGRDLEMADT